MIIHFCLKNEKPSLQELKLRGISKPHLIVKATLCTDAQVHLLLLFYCWFLKVLEHSIQDDWIATASLSWINAVWLFWPLGCTMMGRPGTYLSRGTQPGPCYVGLGRRGIRARGLVLRKQSKWEQESTTQSSEDVQRVQEGKKSHEPRW